MLYNPEMLYPCISSMGTILRLRIIILAASLSPVLVFMVSEAAFKSGYAYALLFAVAAAVLSALYGARVLMEGIARPMAKMSDGVKCFIAGDYKLASVMPREGWPEAGSLISVLNRLMLELSAYRAFHLNQVVEERAKAQALIDTISDGILLVDDRGQLICCNQYALKLFGIPKLEQNIILPGSLRQKSFSAALCEIMASEENYLKAEVDVPGPDEDYSVCRSFRVTSRRFLLATLKRPGRVIVVRDVTVEKEIESARETFFHMITHDMRAPLCSIQGYAQLLAKTLPASSAAAEKCLQPILRSARRLNGMIEDILNTIKLERGDMKLRNDIVDAGILCAAVFEVHEPLAARKGIELSVLPSQEKMAFSGDNALLERVLSNLVGNALKFTSPGGRVRLSCRVAAGEAVFTVEDTGPGIPKEKQAEIFEKYTQLEEHRHMGFGLGLAMCKMALEIHKGRIWVESEEGKGSRFIFSIPLTASRG